MVAASPGVSRSIGALRVIAPMHVLEPSLFAHLMYVTAYAPVTGISAAWFARESQ